MPLTLERLNAAARPEFTALLDGIYEYSPWVAEAAWAMRPFPTLAALKCALVRVLREAGRERQLALIRGHPELAGQATAARSLTAESTSEQSQAGLAEGTPDELAKIRQLNADYHARFGWPFVLAVRGPRGRGLKRSEIITTFERRLAGNAEFEFAECLRNIHRIAEIRLADRFDHAPAAGNLVWDQAEQLAAESDPGFKEQGQLTVTYLTEAHRACARRIEGWMHEAGFDEVHVDAVRNVVGVYHGSDAALPRLLTGSHYDTVRNAGRFDGRLGIFVPMAVVRELKRTGRRLKHGLEVVAFAEEEGQRYEASFLGSGALAGHFDPTWLDQADADGVTMREAMQRAGLPGRMPEIEALARDPARYLGFVEVHIEQGPVLCEIDLPLGVVTSINGGVRYLVEITGQASHAGATPMQRRRDAAAAAAQLLLFVEARAAAVPDLVGTVGLLEVPAGSINVVPGRCRLSLDIRATTDAVRDACEHDTLAELARLAKRRGLEYHAKRTMSVAAAPSAPDWQRRWEAAVQHLAVPVFRLPSGAGHDAMKLHEVMPQAMLFVRGQNSGISHNPLESTTNDDIELAVQAFAHLAENL